MCFEVTLSSHCPSLSKTTQRHDILPQSRVPKLCSVTFLRWNVTFFMLHTPPPIPIYSLSHTSPHEVFLLQSSSTSSSCLQHILSTHNLPPTMVRTNSLICPSPARRTVLTADRSLQLLLWLLQAGKSPQAQLTTSNQP